MTGAEAAQVERSAAARARSQWYVIDTVHVPTHCADDFGLPAGAVLWVNAVWAADEPLFRFHDPADYPRLGKKVVEMANRRHRKAHRMLHRTMESFDTAYWNALDDGEDLALRRMAIHRCRPWETGGALIAGAGGWIVNAAPPLSGDSRVDRLAKLVLNLAKRRADGDYKSADALKTELTERQSAHVFIAKDGIEFVDASDSYIAFNRRLDAHE